MNIDKDIKRCKELIKTEHSNWIGMTNQDAISNVLSDRETWKKIAEKLADKLVEIEDGCKHIPSEICNKYSNGRCKQCIIDWARKEVQNGNK